MKKEKKEKTKKLTKKDKKKIAIIAGIIAVVIIAIIGITIAIINNNEKNKNIDPETEFVEIDAEGNKRNISKKLKETKTFGNMEMNNIELTAKKNVSLLKANFTNKGEETEKEKIVTVEILNKKKEVISSFDTVINKMDPGETIEFSMNITEDISNAYDLTIKEKY